LGSGPRPQRAIGPSRGPVRRAQRHVPEVRSANPYVAAELGYLDEVIRPEQTRPKVIRAFAMLRTKRQALPKRKHGNPPL